MKTYYIIYQVTNKVNGKIYIGSHKTTNLDDGYMGSGKYLRYAQEKYGIENFEKEILHVFDNPEKMFSKEAEIVNGDFLALENTYNLKVGGLGGWDCVNSNYWNNDKRRKHNSRVSPFGPENSLKHRDAIKKGGERGLMIMLKNRAEGKTPYAFTGKKHSKESKRVMSEKAKERLKDPTNNSQYGTMWIHSLQEKKSKKIPKDSPIPEGWIKGRKIKF